METISGQSSLLLTCRREGQGVTVARVETADRHVVLPETVWGLPVTAVGDHAFSPGARETEGELVCVNCGSVRELEADNGKIESVTLPDTLVSVGDYAFYNCFGLRELRLRGSVLDWGGSALMNCSLLDTFHIRLVDDRAEVLCYFADELSRELDATLVYPDGETARLIFPDYREDYVENSPAHHFDYTIYGAGYPYHHVFRQKALDLRSFDELWPGLLATEHDENCALRLAWFRLRHPRGLSPEAGEAYRRYLRDRAGEALDWLLTKRDTRGVAWFLSWAGPDREILRAACGRARRLEAAEAVALLLEEEHRRCPGGRSRTFDL